MAKIKEGAVLKLMRELSGWTQGELARRTGIRHPQQVSIYETGQRRMGGRTRQKMADAFGLPIEEFERLMRSEGDPEMVRTWVQLHEIHNKEHCDLLLKAFQKIISAYKTAQSNANHKEILDHLLRQIDILDRVLHK